MRQNRATAPFIATATLAFALATPSLAATPRTFPVQGHGSLVLDVPASWTSTVEQDADMEIASIKIVPPKGNDPVIRITAVWSVAKDASFNTPENLKRLLQRDQLELANGVVDHDAPISAIDGPFAHGAWFTATEKPSRDDAPAYIHRARAAVGDLMLVVSIASKEKASPAIEEALAMLSGARQAP